MDEVAKLREALAACVRVVEAVMSTSAMPFNHAEIDEALTDSGLIAWKTVPASGDVPDRFEGWEDLEPGDNYWTGTKKWADIAALAQAT